MTHKRQLRTNGSFSCLLEKSRPKDNYGSSRNHKQLWNDARSSAELDKFKQVLQTTAPSTPLKKRSRSRSQSAPKASPKARKNRAGRERQKALLKKAKVGHASTPPPKPDQAKKPARDERVPAHEWRRLLRSSIKEPSDAPSSTAHWDAALVINAARSTAV